MISLAVVINGPVASAGSILIRSNKSGTNDPKTAAITTTKNSDIEIVIPNLISSINRTNEPDKHSN
jgi:hypothetical protein